MRIVKINSRVRVEMGFSDCKHSMKAKMNLRR